MKSPKSKQDIDSNTNKFRAKVSCISGIQKGLALFLLEGDYILGREAPANFIVDESSISRRHLKFIVRQRKVEVCDLQSGNGTYVNGQKIERVTLSHGDRLRVGESEFVFTISNKETSPASMNDVAEVTKPTVLQEETTEHELEQNQPKRKIVSLLFFILLGAVIGLLAAQWFEYQKENQQVALERDKLEDLYDVVMASSSGNFGYAKAKLAVLEKQLKNNFLFEQAKDFVVFSMEFEKAETLASQGKWADAIETMKSLDLSGVWQEPLSSLKQQKNKRLQAWEKRFFLDLQEEFVRALEHKDKEKARDLLNRLGASSMEGGSLAPMKNQLESLLTSSQENLGDKVEEKRVKIPKKSKVTFQYTTDSQAQKSFSSSLDLFRSGSDRQACQNLRQLVKRARPKSVWREKAQSFISRKCMR